MERAELKLRLSNLYIDLRISSDEIFRKLYVYNLSKDERDRFFTELYEKDFLPVKTNNFLSEYSNHEFNFDYFDRYLENLNFYLEKQQKEFDQAVYNSHVANLIFYEMIRLGSPYSDVLYLRYVRQIPAREIISRMYISKPTFYRMLGVAINKLQVKVSDL